MTIETLLTAYRRSGGTLTGEVLNQCADQVWAMMLHQSRGRIREAEDTGPTAELIFQCFRHMVEYLASGENPALQSETLGQWSRSYRDTGRSREKNLLTVLRQYLGETGLLARGV